MEQQQRKKKQRRWLKRTIDIGEEGDWDVARNGREMVKKQKNVLLVIKRGTEREKTVKKGEKNVARLALLTDGT